MTSVSDVAIIGAGPYGLSLASHLLARDMDVRIFGHPMQTWREAMPRGMKLKSEGFASNLSAPNGELTLEEFCSANGIPYEHIGLPIDLSTFIAYGETFQQRFVPNLERRTVLAATTAPHGFDLTLDNGEKAAARRVVVAAGIRSFDFIPHELRKLPRELLTHSVAYGDANHLAGQDVVVIGAGASALNCAAFLIESQASARVLTRRQAIRFQTPLGDRSLYDKIMAPMTPLGPGWKSVLCVRAPMVFHAMPEAFRVDVVRRYLGPAPAWFVKPQVEGHVSYITNARIVDASVQAGRARLLIKQNEQDLRDVLADHVIASTGYRVDLDRLTFLSESIRQGLRRVAGAPVLSRHFESSIPGLYFVGTASANCFGPMMRFAHGANFTSHRLSRHLAARAARKTRIAKPAANFKAQGQLQ